MRHPFAVAWFVGFAVAVVAAGCDCTPPPVRGGEGSPCHLDGTCNAALSCLDGTCVRDADFDGGTGRDDASTPRRDAGPICPAAQICGAACCAADETCSEGACLPPCDSGVVCGPSMACCGADQLCHQDACVTPGAACEELIDCPVGADCDPDLQRCLPEGGSRCEYFPPSGSVSPEEQWHWPPDGEDPASRHVMMTPVVGDLDGDEIPEVAFLTYAGSGGWTGTGILRVVRGDTGEELFTTTGADICSASSIALGDLDGDGAPEIVASGPCGSPRVHAFDRTGALVWSSHDPGGSPRSFSARWATLALADMDGDGTSEVLFDGAVLDSTGAVQVDGRVFTDAISAAYDMDGDGDLEIVHSAGVYHHDGTVLWEDATLPGGAIAVADFFADGTPDIVIVLGGQVSIRSGTTGALIWGPVGQPGHTGSHPGGPPTVADFDDDGLPEIGVAGSASYAVYDPDGSADVLWTETTEDNSSGRTGSSVFDFDGDGSAEVVYNDECYMRIYQGRDGTELARIDNSSHTIVEYPVIVDVDGDGNTEIVVAANAGFAACSQISSGSYDGYFGGIRVFRDANDNWVGTRRVWNQHAYSITHVREDLSVPATITANWQRFNSFRQNPQSFDAPDLTVLETGDDDSGCPGEMVLTASVGNDGAVTVGPGVPVTFYVGEVGGVSREVGTARTVGALRPGERETVQVAFTPMAGETDADVAWYVIVDDAGAGAGEHNECIEDNNTSTATFRCGDFG